jgi:leucyl-tRNA synthetase
MMEGFEANTDDEKAALMESFKFFLICLNPILPHITEELWQQLGESEMLVFTPWPQSDEKLMSEDTITMAVQINGKVKATITLPKDAAEDHARKIALADPHIEKALEGKTLRKFIYVPNRIVNVVAS